MKFSMNGFRRQLSGDCEELKRVVEAVLSEEYHYHKEDLVEAVNNLIRHSNVINCVFIKDDPDFTDMSAIEVEHIELEHFYKREH